MKYVNEFLSLKCAGDVLNICNPIKNVTKEISETMTIISAARKLVIYTPMQYNCLDLCAGNALTSVTSAMLLPFTYSVAVDNRVRYRKWSGVQRFNYLTLNIYNETIFDLINTNTIIVSSHPCSKLSLRIVDLFVTSMAKALFLIPCCADQQSYRNMYCTNHIIQSKLSKYEQWSMSIFDYLNAKSNTCNCEIKTSITRDAYCLSSKNIIISAIRG